MGIKGDPEDWSREEKETVATMLFEKYDQNSNGFIELEELVLMMVEIDRHLMVFGTPERVFYFSRVALQQADMNDDGKLSEEEFVDFFVDHIIVNGFEYMSDFDWDAAGLGAHEAPDAAASEFRALRRRARLASVCKFLGRICLQSPRYTRQTVGEGCFLPRRDGPT